jgi:signal transduction histidine kinase
VVPTTDEVLLPPRADEDAAEQRALAAILVTAAATTQLEEICREHEEHRHEVRAALLGIEAAARALSRHRHLMTEAQLTELAEGLVGEVQRVRTLIDAQFHGPISFDLDEAIAPVLTCMRVEGLVIDSRLPDGLRVEGVPAKTAQVVLALLTNAQRHAPGAPIEISAEQANGRVVVRVDDRGPGIPDDLGDSIFERGIIAGHGGGTGLGLYIARRLMAEQNGTIAWEPRPSGGSSFLLSFGSGGRA